MEGESQERVQVGVVIQTILGANQQMGHRDRYPAQQAAGQDEERDPGCSDVLLLDCGCHMGQTGYSIILVFSVNNPSMIVPCPLRQNEIKV